jgi:hypothetical protein
VEKKSEDGMLVILKLTLRHFGNFLPTKKPKKINNGVAMAYPSPHVAPPLIGGKDGDYIKLHT